MKVSELGKLLATLKQDSDIIIDVCDDDDNQFGGFGEIHEVVFDLEKDLIKLVHKM